MHQWDGVSKTRDKPDGQGLHSRDPSQTGPRSRAFGSKSVADEVHEVAHILLQTWPQQVAAQFANEIPDVLTQTTASRLPPDRPRLNLKASLDPSGRNQDSAIALLEMGHPAC